MIKLVWARVIRNGNILVWTVCYFFHQTTSFLPQLLTIMEASYRPWHALFDLNEKLGPLLYEEQNNCGGGKILRVSDAPPLKNPWNTRLTLPTYWVSGPVYSSSKKNWFHIQPRLVRCSVFPLFSDNPVILSLCECLLVLFWDGITWITWNTQLHSKTVKE